MKNVVLKCKRKHLIVDIRTEREKKTNTAESLRYQRQFYDAAYLFNIKFVSYPGKQAKSNPVVCPLVRLFVSQSVRPYRPIYTAVRLSILSNHSFIRLPWCEVVIEEALDIRKKTEISTKMDNLTTK